MYLLVGATGCAGMLGSEAHWRSLAIPAAYTAIALVVTILAMRHGEGGWSPLDRTCLAAAAISVALWIILDDPRIAVVLPALVDLAGTIPTIRKAWREPAGEHRMSWLLFMIAAAVGCAAVPAYDLANLFYPLCILIGTALVSLGLWRRRSAHA